ncbi:M24 family metallopeptidase [Rhodoligotrophos defluvii]|uniref:M24 family metallopeptidase n=1 Tax=Rhodoligotrophos defluvii TaxID=2561934 RepID=UPI0010C9A6BB|nr:Xaa-Pro peptidase family protein [Rhodoligotrophos defluvii]
MPLHFTQQEFAERQAATLSLMQAQGLDGLLMFRQESMYYLTGYDTFGYVFFQCLVLRADGRMVLLTRAPDARAARYTSNIEDIRIWVDAPEAEPAFELKAIVRELGLGGRRLGIEWDAYGLTAQNGRRVAAALEGFCRLEDASLLVTRQRVVKRPAEIAYVRKAAELADAALAEGLKLARPGAFEGDILAALQGAVFKGDGDYSGNEFIIASGPGAHLGRYTSGRRHVAAGEQLTIEFAGVYRHYHSCLMRVITIGKANARQIEIHRRAMDAMAAATAALRPGDPVGNVFNAYIANIERAGFLENNLNACGYSLGTTFSPNWMDWPMLYRDNPVIAEPGMVFFMFIPITDKGVTAVPGETFLVTETGCERLGKAAITFDTESQGGA